LKFGKANYSNNVVIKPKLLHCSIISNEIKNLFGKEVSKLGYLITTMPEQRLTMNQCTFMPPLMQKVIGLILSSFLKRPAITLLQEKAFIA